MILGSVIPKQLKNACKHFSPMEGFPEFFTTLGPKPSMTKNVSDSKAQQQKQPHHNQHQTHLKTQCDDPNNNKNWMVFFLIIFVRVVLGKSLYDFCLLLFVCCVFLFLFRTLLSFDFLLVRSVELFIFTFVLSSLSLVQSVVLSFCRSSPQTEKQNRQTEKKHSDGWTGW